MTLSRIMAIDYGEVRVGIALSDPLQIISRPYMVLQNRGEELFSELNEIIASQQVSKIVLGIPYNLKGEDTDKTREVRAFAEILKQKVDIPVVLWDERYTTVEANEALKKMGYSSKDSRKVIDKVAASIILKSYLDSQK